MIERCKLITQNSSKSFIYDKPSYPDWLAEFYYLHLTLFNPQQYTTHFLKTAVLQINIQNHNKWMVRLASGLEDKMQSYCYAPFGLYL